MQQHHGSRCLLVGSSVVAVFLASTACGAESTFSVHGRFGGTADMVDDAGNCRFDKTTYEVGDDVILRGADSTIVATDHLTKGNDSKSGAKMPCDLTFQFDDVRPRDVAYQLIVDASQPIILTEQQLRDNGLEVMPEVTRDGLTPTTEPDPSLKLTVHG